MSKKTLQESTGQLDWEALRTVLAIVRGRGLSGASRVLGTQHSTVFRRLESIEHRLGVRLFERDRGGYRPTAHGEVIAEAARAMEEAALTAERRVLGADSRLTGPVRIATSELLASYLLPHVLKEFLASHPGIDIEITVANRQVDLERREADVALRVTPTPAESLVGRRLATVRYALFVSPALVADRITPPQPESLPWVGFDAREGDLQIMRWFKESMPQVKPRLRADSLMSMMRAAASGVGAVVLPAFAGAQEPCLIRMTAPLEEPVMDLWLLHHPDVRGNARVRALMQHLSAKVPGTIARMVLEGPVCSSLKAARARRAVAAVR